MTAVPGRAVAARAARPVIRPERYAERLDRARVLVREQGVAGLLVGFGADLLYLTGYHAMGTERLTMLVLPAEGPASLVAPRLEAMKAAGCPAASAGLVEVVPWDETDDAHAIATARFHPAGMPPSDAPALVNSSLWAMHVLGLQRAMPGRRFGLATQVLRELRMAKDPDEIELLRLAAQAADRALAEVAAGPLIGRTEAEVSREIRDRLLAEGHDEAAFAIVASGPNSASPHHEPGSRRLAAGEPVVLDIGGTLGGYASDTTRTIWIAGPRQARPPDATYLEVHELVRKAQVGATGAVRPGVTCEAIDATARRTIAAGGFGPQFLHRVGHGIGLEGHEEPYLVQGNAEPLRAGVSFSIEPGIYLAGRFGVRIEDIVVCVEHGPDVLNELPREAWVVTG